MLHCYLFGMKGTLELGCCVVMSFLVSMAFTGDWLCGVLSSGVHADALPLGLSSIRLTVVDS